MYVTCSPSCILSTGQYYAVEDMLTTLPGEKYGARTLLGHYERVLREGQEYDPYTTMLAPRSR